MRYGKPENVEREQELLEDEHRAGEEIYLFLERKRQEINTFFRNAAAQAEDLRALFTREVHEEKGRLSEQIISESKTKAGETLEKGSLVIERLIEHFDELGPSFIRKIVDYGEPDPKDPGGPAEEETGGSVQVKTEKRKRNML